MLIVNVTIIIIIIIQMEEVRDKVKQLFSIWKEATETEGIKDITAEFALRCKRRDLEIATKV